MTKIAISTNLIDRKTASRLLKTSLRTIDRYRQIGRLATTVIDNKIYVKKAEIEELITRQSRQQEKAYMSIDNRVDRGVDRGDMTGDKRAKTRDVTQRDATQEEKISGHHEHPMDVIEYYKKMLEELGQELREKQGKLEGANYRVGQLEAQIKYSVPLLEYQQKTRKLLAQSQEYKKQSQENEAFLVRVKKDLSIERLNKRVYLAIVLILILIQPLWLYLAKNF